MSNKQTADQVASANDLLERCARFLEVYPDRPAKLSANSQQIVLAAEIASHLETFASQVVPCEHWKGDSSCGKGNWSRIPWAAIYDTRITSKASEGVYPVIHFLFDKEDGAPTNAPGIRLGIGVSVTAYTGTDRKARVDQVLHEIRSIVDEKDLRSYWLVGSSEPRPTLTPPTGYAAKYAEGMILEQFIAAEDLTTRQPQIALDLQSLLHWYSDWVNLSQGMPPLANEHAASFLEMMRHYHDAGTVFLSPTRSNLYCVDAVNESSCTIRRLSANKPQRCTASSFQSSLQKLIEAGGKIPFKKFVTNTQLTRTTFAQAACTSLSADRKEVLFLDSPEQAVKLLCAYIDQMRVDKSSGTPKLYKPLILASVLQAIQSGELKENRIDFSWTTQRLMEQGQSHGMDFTEQNAADGFTRLSREPFWLLCYQNPENAVTLLDKNQISPANVKNSVQYAMLRQPFWEALQAKQHCEVVLNHLRKTRVGPYVRQINIDSKLLKLAVDLTIRPFLVDQGKLDDPKSEGFHHQKAIPSAQPHLTREALDEDAVTHVKSALKASSELLSRFDKMPAIKLLDKADPEQVRNHFVDLLHGADELNERLRQFFDWADTHKSSNGSKVSFNATAVSYLLAVSNPQRYAFCKPEVYQEAAEALLGSNNVVSDPVDRLSHCIDFYQAALTAFQQSHSLPFRDLMHSHIAFYLMKDGYHGLPIWKDLPISKVTNGNGGKVKLMNDVNVVLYGPPGTGKTYHAMSRAVEICDGVIADDRDEIVQRFKTLRAEGQIEFVTFHQSYGYEDFVEGIRPVLAEGDEVDAESPDSQVQYTCRDGVLKRICSQATTKETKRKGGYNLDPAHVRVWKMSLGNTNDPEQAVIFDECVENSWLLLGYGRDLDFTGCDTRKAVDEKVRGAVPKMNKIDFTITAVHAFKNKMQVDDLVVISDGNHKFRAIGRVAGDYQLLDRDSYRQMRPVEWLVVYDVSLPHEKIYNKVFSQASIYKLRPAEIKTSSLQEMLRDNLDEHESDIPTSRRNYVLIIDEINRGNIAKILGELITLLEPDKRLGAANELQATLPYSGESFGVPQNLFLLGTMNTADRSIAFLDTALRRRFKFVEMMPDSKVIQNAIANEGIIENINLPELLDTINRRVELLYDRDHQIGHSYFLGVSSLDELREVFCSKIIPLLQEYFYGDWVKICMILGCSYERETGKQLGSNAYPIINAQLLRVSDLPGGEQDDCEDKIRCEISREFMSSNTQELGKYFQGVISAKSTTSPA